MESAAEGVLPDFDLQCESLLDARPRAISSIMGLYAAEFVAQMKKREIFWIATATTVSEARAAEAAGADAIIAQGAEAGGHRAAFDARTQKAGCRVAQFELPSGRNVVEN